MTSTSTATNDLKVQSMKLGQRARLTPILQSMTEQGFIVQRQLELAKIATEETNCFVFANGVVVNWGDATILDLLIKQADEFFNDTIENPVVDELSYAVGDEFAIEHDVILVPGLDPEIMLSISHALAKEVQLSYNETIVDAVVARSQPLANQLAEKGTMKMGKKAIKKMIGLILQIQFNISVSTVVQDKPELFWDQPELERYYNKLGVYLDLNERSIVVQKKLEALYATAEILRDETNTRYAHILEWIVIILILWEVCLGLFEKGAFSTLAGWLGL